MRVEPLTPVLRAAPGERARCRLRIENTDAGPTSYGLRVVGFDESNVLRAPGNGPLAAGSAEEVELEFLIPEAFAVGHHSVAVEVLSDRPGSTPVIAGITVAVGQIDDVAMAVVPSTVRGHRRGKFRLDLDNRSREVVDLELGGEGPELAFTLRPDRVALRPGDRVRTSGKVKAPRHFIGEPRQLSFTITARSKSTPSYAPATFHQRPVFPRGLRTLLGVLLVFAIWAGALGAGVYWWTQRDEQALIGNYVPLVDIDGDGVPETPADQPVDINGDGEADKLASEVAAEVAANGAPEPQPGAVGVPTRTVIGGTVKAGETGDDANIGVTLSPIDLASPAEEPTATGPAGQIRPLKRPPVDSGGFDQPGVSATRRTVSVKSRVSGPDGAWQFAAVAIRQTYELHFFREGFDSESFVVTPPQDGSPVQMDVVLEPASGALSGTVFGPGGPLGNVDLVLTDGELTFHTTTASDGDVGTWSLSGVSTPGTYTLTATLRGYGTEVLQITLDPGEERTGVDVSMIPNVGSIIGRVSADGEPLGGVTLTASSGDFTTTTTSLTEGDTGFYTFPRLSTPGRYTVTAEADGYVAQDRLVTVGGNVNGVDFNLERTTAAITGLVVSVGTRGPDDVDAGPLPNAQITVRRDDLSFETSSASARARKGEFKIKNLPPGTYLVEFSRFDHRPASKLVTLAAGESKDLGQIPLRFRPRGGIAEEGRIFVRVRDGKQNELGGATVTVEDVATGETVRGPRTLGEDDSTVLFRDMNVGTYIVEGTKQGFESDTERVSVGPSGTERVDLVLFERGQATGSVVDSLTGESLDNYEITLRTVLPNGAVGDKVNVDVDVQADPESPDPDNPDWIWATDEQALREGTYQVEVTDDPPGYRVVRDQVLLEGLPEMRFRIPYRGQDKVALNAIEADPLPNITGQVFAPRFVGPDQVSYAPINIANLTVELDCRDDDLGDIQGAVETDGDDDVNALLDSYELTKDVVDVALGAARDEATCTLEFADGDGDYEPVSTDVRLEPSDGTANPDIVLNAALFTPSAIDGTAYWLNKGNGNTPMAASAIDVDSAGRVIIGFEPSRGAANPTPIHSIGPLHAETPTLPPDTIGRAPWSFEPRRQVFGRMNYTFSDPSNNYVDREIAITVNEDGRSVAPVQPPGNQLRLDQQNDRINVELDADGGTINGRLEIRSNSPVVDGFAIELTPPPISTTAIVEDPDDEHIGTASATTDDPGSYDATFTPPDPNHYYEPTPVPLFQAPGENEAFTQAIIELADIEVTIVDGLDQPLPNASVNVAHTHDSSVPGDPDSNSERRRTDEDGFAPFRDRLVNTVSPVDEAVPYAVTVAAISNHDMTGNSDTVTVEAGDTVHPGVTLGPGDPLGPRIRLPEFGSITGTVVGRVPGQSDDIPLSLASGVHITAQRRFDLNQDPVTEVPVEVSAVSPNGFSFRGMPGYYTIDVSHDDYDPGSAPPVDATIAGLPVYRMTNLDNSDAFADEPHAVGQWVLNGKPGVLDVTVHDDTLTGANVPDATIELARISGSTTEPVVLGPDNLTEDPAGRFRVTGLPQGDYVLTIRERDATTNEDLSFPVIVTVNVPFGSSEAARTRVVHAPLPSIGADLVGEISAENSEQDPVRVPEVTVSRDYTSPQVQVGPGPSIPGTTVLVDNAATEDNVNPVPAASVTVGPSADGSPVRYRFEHLATGTHVLSFSSDDEGYSEVGDVTEVVDSIEPLPPGQTNVDPVQYEAEDRRLEVHVTTGCEDPPNDATPCVDVRGATVTLTQTDPDDLDEDVLQTGSDGTSTFDVVPPEVTDYEVEVEHELFNTKSATVQVPPGDPEELVEADVDLAPAFSRIIGLARKRQSSSSTVDLANEGTATLIDLSADPTEAAPTKTPGGECDDDPTTPRCNYLFDVPVAELAAQYRIRLELTGYATRESAPFSAPAGVTTSVPTLVVPALATVSITVNGPAANAPMNVAITAPSSQTGVTASRNGRVFTFKLDPGTNPGTGFSYVFQATSPDFVAATVPGGPLTLAPGQTVSRTVTLTRRDVSGTIDDATNNTRVELRDANGGLEDTTTTDNNGDYSFEGVDAGTWTIVSARFGVGRGEITRTIDPTDPSITNADFALRARNVNVSFTVTPSDATVVLRSGNTTIDSTPPLRGTERQLPFTLRASRTGFVTQDVNVPSPNANGSFNALSFDVDAGPITLEPNPPPRAPVAPAAPTTTTTAPPPTTTTTPATVP